MGRQVTSISSGSESISYSAAASGQSTASALIGDVKAQNEAYKTILEEGFRGIPDANGVNLLYLGVYPLDIRGTDDV